MRRSWLALIAAVVIIGGAIALSTYLGPKPPEPGPEPSSATPSTKATVETPTPSTAAPSTKTTAGPPRPTTASPRVEPPRKPVPAAVLLKQADELTAARKPLEAIRALSRALLQGPRPAEADPVKARLTKLVDEVLFSARACPPLSITHEVASGDRVWKLARKHRTTVELIAKLNGLKDPGNIRPGQRLKIIPGGFDVEVVKSEFRLTVTKDGLWVREFQVGLGKDGTTPVGSFVVGQKLTEPTYFGDGAPVPFEDKKNNPLGTRWITIEGAGLGQYGIHGTWEPASIGKEESKGCVRMRNEDVEWLFPLIVSDVSKIVIKP